MKSPFSQWPTLVQFVTLNNRILANEEIPENASNRNTLYRITCVFLVGGGFANFCRGRNKLYQPETELELHFPVRDSEEHKRN